MNKRTIALVVAAAVVVAIRIGLRKLRSDPESGIGQWASRVTEVLGLPTGANPYWRTLPLRRATRLLAGAFLLASVAGFAVNIILVTFSDAPLVYSVVWPLILASLSTCLLILRLKKPRWLTLWPIVAAAILFLVFHFQTQAPQLPPSQNIRNALILNSVGIWIGGGLGLRLIMSFLTTEGVASVRMQTELTLAQGIQATLVPPISFTTSRFEVFGVSLPSAEVGGDLVDAVVKDGDLIAYVADISGHGLPAGQLMGMLKTAVRVSLELRQQPIALLGNADRVLPGLKQPDMYATLALLRFDDSSEAEYCLAGHPPILHYRRNSNDVVRLAMQQFPVGLLGSADYVSARTPYSQGDLFVILTDGIVEVADERGEEFGFERVEKLIISHAAEPLANIWNAFRSAAHAHGPQQDDQSGLLVRALSG